MATVENDNLSAARLSGWELFFDPLSAFLRESGRRFEIALIFMLTMRLSD